MTALFVLMALGLLWFAGCTTPGNQDDLFPNQRAIIGKTRQELLACAGPPLREAEQADHRLLTYYRHTPVLDRAVVSSKSTVPTVHPACWATVSLEGEVVSAAQYQSVPSSADATDQCEAIFDPCS
jgi:hypothetical protein